MQRSFELHQIFYAAEVLAKSKISDWMFEIHSKPRACKKDYATSINSALKLNNIDNIFNKGHLNKK